LNGPGFKFQQRQKLISSPKCRNWLWDERSHLFNGTGILSRRYSGRDVRLTTHLHLVLRLRMSGAMPLLPCMPSWLRKGLFHLNVRWACFGLVPGVVGEFRRFGRTYCFHI